MKTEIDDLFIEGEVEELKASLYDLQCEIGRVIVGQKTAVNELLVAILAGGHALLEGVPGLAKTLMVKTLSEAVELNFSRIQFTPDLMPGDIIGTEILEEDHTTGKRFFKFLKGPIFSNIVLADEINRTPPRTQAALLEAMQEKEVTYSGETYKLTPPFFVLATQNPIEQAGTYPLPEAQRDRFLVLIRIDYPTADEEIEILRATTGTKKVTVKPVMSAESLIRLQDLVRSVVISDDLIKKISEVIRATRPESTDVDFVRKWVRWGAGPRAGQALILTAKAHAILQGRYAVTPADIKAMIYPVLRHRVLVNFKAEAERITSDQVTDVLVKHFL